MSFLHGFFPGKCQEKLDAQMSGIRHPMSFLYMDSSIENVKKRSVPTCHE